MVHFESDRAVVAAVRKQHDLSNRSLITDGELQTDLDTAKTVISREVHERLTNGDELNFYNEDAAQDALYNLALLRVADRKARKDGADGPRVPHGISKLRRTDFGDQTMNHWRDQVVRGIDRI